MCVGLGWAKHMARQNAPYRAHYKPASERTYGPYLPVTGTCHQCGRVILPRRTPKGSVQRYRRFCNATCMTFYNRARSFRERRVPTFVPIEAECDWCTIVYMRTHPKRRYCSQVCLNKGKMRGKYNLSSDQYRSMLDAQGHRCAICRRIPDGWQVDHDHTTGAVRGLLCKSCNTTLGMVHDDPDVLRAAAAYVEEGKARLFVVGP